MPPRFTSAESARVHVQITCERCGHAYATMQKIVGASRDLSLNAAQAGAHGSLASTLDRIRLGDCSALAGAPCPQCGYVQSWRLANRMRAVGQVSAYTAGALGLVVLLTLGLAGGLGITKSLAVVIAIVGGAACYLLARPVVALAYRSKVLATRMHAARLPSVEIETTAERVGR
jgi:anti-sigma factor RsiW